MEQGKPKIVGKKIGQAIEQAFAEQFRALRENGISFEISIKEIQERVPNYSAGNGHSALRDGTQGGEQIGYLCYHYQVKKNYKNGNPKSELVSLEFSKKE